MLVRTAPVLSLVAAGTGGALPGLAFRSLGAGRRPNIPRTFAALPLVAATCVAIRAALSHLGRLLLRLRLESALGRKR